MVRIQLEGVGRDFGERRVLSDLTLDLAAGDRLLVRGANGSGKTTLLKILGGLLEPTRGKVTVRNGEKEISRADFRRGTGYVAPDLVLYDEFTPLENLDFFGRLRGLGADPARDRGILTRVGLAERGEDPLGTLSTGLRQRAKLAFAIQPVPALLLLDEPSSNLDDAGRELVRGIVEEAEARGAVTVVASNDQAEFALGKRVLELG